MIRLRQTSSGTEIAVKVAPRAARCGIAGALGDRLKVRVTAPPEKGKANREVELVLAEVLGVAESRVRVVSGGASRQKTVRVEGMTAEEVREKIDGA